jgi:hypothetical protein
MYPLIEAATAHEHRDDLLREAARERRAASARQHHRRGPWRVRLGRTLVQLGTRLACDAPAAGVRAVSP